MTDLYRKTGFLPFLRGKAPHIDLLFIAFVESELRVMIYLN